MRTHVSNAVEEMVEPAKLEPIFSQDSADSADRDRAIHRLRVLWEERRLVFRASMCGLLAFTLLVFLIPKRFESSVLLMPPDDQSSSGMMLAATLASKVSGSLGGIAGDVLGMKSTGDLFIGILRSRTVQDNVINKFDLRKVYGTKEWQRARMLLGTNTSIAEDRKSGIITIVVTDHDPQRAADIAGEYVTQLNTVVSQLSTSSAHRERVFLEERILQVRQDLESAEKDFSEFASKNGAIDIKEQGRAMVESAAGVEGQLIAAQSELQGLKQIYSENNIRVRSLRARISELQNQLQQLGGKQEVAADATSSGSGDLYPSIRKLPLLGVPYADLYRKTRVQEAVFESLTQEYELAKVAEAKEIPSVKVLDPPNVPERKSFPPRLAIMFLGTFLCCAAATVWVLGKARWQEIPQHNQQKVLAEDVFRTINARMPWATPNGSRVQAMSHKVWVRVTRRPSPSNGAGAEHSESGLLK
jgi:capsule polysaccharide export protein KpsE/RkpR